MPETSKRKRDRTKDNLAFSPKARIFHTKFGTGTIVAIDEHLTTIAFDEGGARRFLTSLVEIAPSDTPAPAKPAPKKKKKAKAASSG